MCSLQTTEHKLRVCALSTGLCSCLEQRSGSRGNLRSCVPTELNSLVYTRYPEKESSQFICVLVYLTTLSAHIVLSSYFLSGTFANAFVQPWLHVHLTLHCELYIWTSIICPKMLTTNMETEMFAETLANLQHHMRRIPFTVCVDQIQSWANLVWNPGINCSLEVS
jgi:hypothetical protein